MAGSLTAVAILHPIENRCNLTQGMLFTAIGLGGFLSNLMAGFLVQKAGYNVGFLTLAAIAVVAFVVLLFFVPESKTDKTGKKQGGDKSAAQT